MSAASSVRIKAVRRIKNCVNTGVAAGYNAYIGGICGANENKAAIINCASYVSDTNNAIYRRVTDWGAVGSYAGGLTGYNNGTITFSDKDNAVSNRSVAGIVVGRHYVGGLVGYNDTDGTIDINYTLIGGRVAATGDCVGGLVGLNASTELLEKKLTIKPSSVQGRYYVGGAIGANVVNPGENVTVSGLKVDNSLGTVTAEAFCGGLIGYQRTYTSKTGQAERCMRFCRASRQTTAMRRERSRLLPIGIPSPSQRTATVQAGCLRFPTT